VVYSNLTLSASQANWLAGAGVMFSFGMGTFSVMLATVLLGQQLNHVMGHRWLQVGSGLMVLALGVYQVVTLL
jgi:sulfite exporter TauE/SafE